jgi:hypothetical protein
MQISLPNPTFDQIVDCIVNARSRNAKCFVTFPWPEEQFDHLRSRLYNRLRQLDTIAPRRLEYDFHSKTVQLDMAETKLHSLFAFLSALLFLHTIGRLVPSVQDAAVRLRLKAVVNFATSQLELEGKLSKQADWAFGCATDYLPSLVCEVSFSQSWKDMRAKIVKYIKSSAGNIRAGIVFNVEYPDASMVTVSLATADDSAADGYC